MLAESGGADAPPGPQAAVTVIVALELERRCFRLEEAEAAGVSVRCAGPGATRAGRAAERALALGAHALVSFGLAGGLLPQARPGTLLLPARVLTADGRGHEVDAAWRARVAAAAVADEIDVLDAPLLAIDSVLSTPGVKARAGAESGAAAADMESGGIAAAAARADVPFLVVRAVADGPDDPLPADIASWVDAHGRPRASRVARAVLAPPGWPALFRLAARYGAARRTLDRTAHRLAAERFLLG